MKTKQEYIEVQIRRKKWIWIGYTLRRVERDIVREGMKWNPAGSRRIRRSIKNMEEDPGREILRGWQDMGLIGSDGVEQLRPYVLRFRKETKSSKSWYILTEYCI